MRFCAYRSWTLKSGAKQTGLEPDECYIVGADQSKARPDLAIEVIWTSGGIDKLEVYRRLGIGEVWLWADGVMAVHIAEDAGDRRSTASNLFPELDLALLCSFLDRRSLTVAKREFRAALTAGR